MAHRAIGYRLTRELGGCFYPPQPFPSEVILSDFKSGHHEPICPPRRGSENLAMFRTLAFEGYYFDTENYQL